MSARERESGELPPPPEQKLEKLTKKTNKKRAGKTNNVLKKSDKRNRN
jgi:hypothetical protein